MYMDCSSILIEQTLNITVSELLIFSEFCIEIDELNVHKQPITYTLTDRKEIQQNRLRAGHLEHSTRKRHFVLTNKIRDKMS